MGQVYQATDTKLNRQVALKTWIARAGASAGTQPYHQSTSQLSRILITIFPLWLASPKRRRASGTSLNG